MTKREKIEALQMAQEKFIEAIDTIAEIFEDDPNANAYWIGHARILASEGHGYLSRDLNIDDLIRRIEEND